MAPPNAELYNNSSVASSTTSSPLFKVNSSNVQYTEEHILSKYTYSNTLVTKQADGTFVAQPTESTYEFKTERTVPRVG
jgi:myo-inositol-1-phosphate synthase